MKSLLFYICQNWGGRLPPFPCFRRPWLLESHQSNQLCTLYRLLLSFITCMCWVYSLFWTNQSFHRYCACSFLLPFCPIFGSGMKAPYHFGLKLYSNLLVTTYRDFCTIWWYIIQSIFVLFLLYIGMRLSIHPNLNLTFPACF